MTDTPRWHGWATPDQCREMIFEMKKFLKKIGEWDIPKSVKINDHGVYEFTHFKRDKDAHL
jgi:hypothetical protein